jgi:uncharacterized protein
MIAMRICRNAALLALLLIMSGGPAEAQRVDTLRVSVAPDIELLTIVHRPLGEGRHPVVLIRSPYGRYTWLAERLVTHGYAVVDQAVRGTGGSSGVFVPFAFEARDGAATADWIGRQEWAGPVGLWGISYPGWAAYALAETGHPAIAALAVGSAWAEMQPFLFPGGALHLGAHLPWIMGFAGGPGVPTEQEFGRIARTLPLEPLFRAAAQVLALGARPYRWDAVRAPALHFTGWHDYIYRDALRGYEQLSARAGTGAPQRLVVGAWSHNGEKTGETRVGDVDFGPAAAAGFDSVAAWTRRFFDAHLRGLPEVDAPVRVFVMGENRWAEFDAWPPAGATAASWYLAGDGRLDDRPENCACTTRFAYDPRDPLPTTGGVNAHFFPGNLGPLDQAPLDGRRDVARFLTAPLARPLVLAGPLRAVLHVAADAPSTDIAVRLSAVGADGTARLIEDGIRRIERVDPGVNEVVVELGQRALRLEAGTRLRLDVSGGNFPKYDRNPNTGEAPLEATELKPVIITVHHGAAHASRLEVVTMDAGAAVGHSPARKRRPQ